MRYFILAVALGLAAPALAQKAPKAPPPPADPKEWLESQGLAAAETKSFGDYEVVIARATAGKEEKVVVFTKGKATWQSNPKENPDAAKWVIHSLGRDLDGDGQPELHLSAHSGGAHCCTTHYVYRLKPQVKRHAMYPANNVGGGDFLELPGRKTPVMVSADDASALAFAPNANSYFPAVILEVSPKGRIQFATDLMRSKLPGQPPPVCGQPTATANPWLKQRCDEYTSSRRNARVAEMKTKLAEIKTGRSADQLKWDDYYATGVLSAVSAEMNRYAYTGHAAAGINWLENVWPGNDATKLKLLTTLRQTWGKSVFAEDLKTLASDYR